MDLYQITKSGLKAVEKSAFDLERDIQVLVEANLGNLLNCCQFRSTTKESFSIVNHCSNIG